MATDEILKPGTGTGGSSDKGTGKKDTGKKDTGKTQTTSKKKKSSTRKSSSSTTITTTNTTKSTDAARKQQINDLVRLLQTAAGGGIAQLDIDLGNMLDRLQSNFGLSQNQYNSVTGALQSGYGAQIGALDDIQESTEKALSEETTTTTKEWGRMLRELNEQMAGLGVGETDNLIGRASMNVDRAMQLNQSLRGAYDTTNSRNQQAAAAYTDATSAMVDLNNSFDREIAEMMAAYETDTNNRAKAEYASQADSYKQIASAWDQYEAELAQRLDELSGQKVTSKSNTKSGGVTYKSTDTTNNVIKTSMSKASLKRKKAAAKAAAKTAYDSAALYAGKTTDIKAPTLNGAKSNFSPTLSKATLNHNADINEGQAQTSTGKRVSGSTLKWS